MGKTVFVPLTDDLLYEHPEMILGPVIPFSQQARWSPVKPASFSLVTASLDAKTKLKTERAYEVTHSKRGKSSLTLGELAR